MSMIHIFSHPLVRNRLGNISYEQELTVQYNAIFISTCDISVPKKAGYNNVCT